MSRSSNEPPEATVRRWTIADGERRQAPFPNGPDIRVVVGAGEGAAIGVLEVTMPAGGVMPDHEHGDSAVLLAPTAGRLRLVETEGGDRSIEIEPGAVATIPVGVHVRLENPGDVEARTLVVLTPPDFAERLDGGPAERTLAPEAGEGEQTLAAALEREHREIDQAIEAYLAAPADGPERVEHLTQAMTALRRHIYLEEEFLFPPLREAGFVAPIFVMLREHGELWQTMDEIARDLAGDEPGLHTAGQCKWLLAQLERHNSKEEPILYPHADGVLGATASSELTAFLRTGRMPGGWICARAGATPGTEGR
jgi:quercetin dioxygenase-like cupin family protein/hemerythrin-like domain-containing protein